MKYLKLYEVYRHGKIGVGVLPIYKDKILIQCRGAETEEPFTWGVWGGRVEKNENLEEAVIREFREETDYDGEINLIESFIYREEGFEYHNFIGILDKEFEPVLDWESEDYKWVTMDELLDVRPMHFGLEELLKNDIAQIKDIVE